MPNANDLASTALGISVGIVMIAAFLGIRQRYDQQGREPDLSDVDRKYFFRQDVRRGVGVFVMLMLAAGLAIGVRIAPKVEGRPSLLFAAFWLGVVGLLVVMISLAGVDLVETRLYARRQRQSLARERIELLRDLITQSAASEIEGHDEGEPGGD